MKCMLEITIAPEVIAKFKELLVEEDNEDAVFRIRETKWAAAERATWSSV